MVPGCGKAGSLTQLEKYGMKVVPIKRVHGVETPDGRYKDHEILHTDNIRQA